MKDEFEQRLKEMVQRENAERTEIPADYDAHIEKILRNLPEKRKKHMRWKQALVLAAVLTAMLSVTATAAVNYVRLRMDAMDEKERLGYYQASQSVSVADFYSRELTDGEKKRMESLKEAYQKEGLFPEGELTMIEKASEYSGSGVACLAVKGTFFLPETELSDEEILQIIDFREKREFGLQDIAKKMEEGKLDESEVPPVPAAPPVELKAGDMEIICKGDTRAELAASSANAVYFGEQRLDWNGKQAALYRLDTEGGRLVKMDVSIPEDMSPEKMTTDAQGNLCVILTTPEKEMKQSVIWKLAPDGKRLSEFALPDSAAGYQAIAVDGQGRYYLSEWKRGQGEVHIYILDQAGNQVSTVSYKDGDIRALGRGKDGKVYGVLMDGRDWEPAVVSFDAEKGKIAEKYENVLPEGNGAYTVVSAGVNSDLLIWGSAGIYSYNLGDKKAAVNLAQYELPDAGVVTILPDGRAVFIKDNLFLNEDETEIKDIVNDRIYLITTK